MVTAKLPERDGEFEYHIKHTGELHERIARESELGGSDPWRRDTVVRPSAMRISTSARCWNLRLIKWLAARHATVRYGGFHLPMPNNGPERAGMVRGRCVRG